MNKKKLLSSEEIFALQKKKAAKSKRKYTLGRRMYFTRPYCGYPTGVKATVIETWPTTTVLVDKFKGKGWFGAKQNKIFISESVDKVLEPCDQEEGEK